MWLITVAHAVNEFYSVALPPILPLLVNDFAITYGEAGALLTIFFATYSIFQLPAGVLADRIGQRWLLAGGMIVLSAGILIAASAQGYWTLVIAEVIAGIGGSTYHPSGMSIISDLESGATEGKAMGIHGLGGVVGTALAPALVGGLAALFDWRLALTVSAGVGVVYAVVFLAAFHPKSRSDGNAPIEPDGGTDERAAPRSPEESDGWVADLTSLISVPLEPWVAVLFLANLAIATELGAVRTFATSFLVEQAGTTAGVANAIFFVLLVGAGISSLAAGSLADSMDRRALGFGALAASTIVLGATAVVPLVPIVLFGWFFLLGIAMWAALPAMNAITSQYSERRFSGSLFGVMLTAGSLGGAIGPLLFGVAAERFGLGAAFPLVAIISAGGAIAFLGMYRI
ncbi:major facilitator superfamily protein [Halococcus salifodinae DSM 8989]|uniref:Major facilitator superfamily protein n=1 Tax=Halococcus salifodinae DSM 8989 TaxID=1227456 RepID=M0MQU8_9EURY|nr:major facilitator superfamily protein [Halococcus salifodinae DSM 8989]